MSSFKSFENIQKKVYRADCTVLNTKFSSVTLSGNESQRKGMVISSFNKAANRSKQGSNNENLFRIHVSKPIIFLFIIFLAHLSRRLIGELIVYEGISRPSVRPSFRLSTFSNDISSEAARPILLIFHI